ncbi:MAG: aspartate carbamoyltransferase [Candidatus Delongbacteria bacterium]|nr:aspartate carbamoyltransferase [Candidatus Delongbacteria bacterium]MBN2834116.1 aspartate carbamoyltransferase [Candidatus Delongbacteria bacterium]
MGSFKGNSIVSLKDMTKEEILYLLQKAADVKSKKVTNILKDKVVASLFFEPSTRTRLSFESAVLGQGGSVFGFADPGASSVKKGETLSDTIKNVMGYCDAIVMRHFIEGAARRASEISTVPVINGGDGANQHPTQTFLDLFTMMEKRGSLENMTVGLMGDLKYGRTIHSLSMALTHFNVKLYLISPNELKLPEHYCDYLRSKNIEFVESSLEECGKELDFLYCTRIQKERFFDPMEYDKVVGSYKVNKATLELLKDNTYIMHPLPRVDEISVECDDDPRAVYFEQAHNGVPVRSALLALTIGTLE